jgi:hypothetical protein
MKPTFSFRVTASKYSRNSYKSIIFWVDASSRAEAIRLATPRLEVGYEIETVRRPKAFHLENG